MTDTVDDDVLASHGGWPGLLTELLAGRDLSAEQARSAMATILGGRATPAQLIGFVVALRAKGETADEISGLLPENKTPIEREEDGVERGVVDHRNSN